MSLKIYNAMIFMSVWSSMHKDYILLLDVHRVCMVYAIGR